jgi:predicted acyltransferase
MSSESRPGRLVSLDAFRGLTIAGMILVNNPGSWSHVFPPLRHAPWHGWTPTDLVFPFFLFIVGVAMTFSLGKRLADQSTGPVHRKILRRAAILFALGLLLALFPDFDFDRLRIVGVLQRIAVVYAVVALLVVHTTPRAQAIITVLILVGYHAAMLLIPVPGHGAGVLTPEGNLAAWVDQLLTPGRLWKGTWDPEGLLSTIPAVGTALMGVLCGYRLRASGDQRMTGGGMFVAGWALIVAGLLWGIWFPINKNLWSSSYVVFTAGAALQLFGVCWWLIEVRGKRRWFAPAIVLGMNPITAYVLSGLAVRVLLRIEVGSGEAAVNLKTWTYRELLASWLPPTEASLAWALAWLGIWIGLMWILYRAKIFIRI